MRMTKPLCLESKDARRAIECDPGQYCYSQEAIVSLPTSGHNTGGVFRLSFRVTANRLDPLRVGRLLQIVRLVATDSGTCRPQAKPDLALQLIATVEYSNMR